MGFQSSIIYCIFIYSYLGHHPVLVGNPFGELLHVLFDLVVLGVEDVDPVLGGPDPVLVDEVVAVAANVITLV
jgi:hypothetical protein